MRLTINEGINPNLIDVFMWNAYIDEPFEYECASCGKPLDPTDYLSGEESDYFIYDKSGANGGLNPYNLPKEDNVGNPFIPVMSLQGDDEGYAWKNFCKRCWNTKVKRDKDLAKWFTNEDIAIVQDRADELSDLYR